MPSAHDIITIQNISDEDFTFGYGLSEGNTPYIIPAGEVKRFPRFLADHAVKHLVDKILTDKKIKTNNQPARAEVAAQIILQEETFEQAPTPTEAEQTKVEVENLNKKSDLDSILESRKAKPKEEIATTPPVEEPKEEFVGLKPTVAPIEPKPVEEPKVEVVTKALPTKRELLDYAEHTLKLVMDEPNKDGKTLRQIYSHPKMTNANLIKELNYPLEDE